MIRKLIASILAVVTLAIAGLGLGAHSASAEVVRNMRFDAVVVPSPDNPCEPGTYPIAFSGIEHHVWYTTPEGTIKMHNHAHLTGTDADGTEYILNAQRHMEHPNARWVNGSLVGSITPFNDTFTQNLVSKGGSTVNARIVKTYNMWPLNPVVTVTACRG